MENDVFTPCNSPCQSPTPSDPRPRVWQWVPFVGMAISAFMPWSIVTWILGPWAGA
jgi:hypothetical protein